MKTMPDEIERWRIEIESAEDFRDKQFGKRVFSNKSGTGENIDFFETGMPSGYLNEYGVESAFASINVIYPIVKNIIPTLYYKNPYISAIPKRAEDEVSSGYVSSILNYYFKELRLKNVNQQVIFDAFVHGMGISKLGYTTKFGTMPTEENVKEEKKERERTKSRTLLEKIGLKKPKEEEPSLQNFELDEYIRAESPYVSWVDPFKFLIDPRATSIENAMWCGVEYDKTVESVKANKNYSNTKDLKGEAIDEHAIKDVPETQLDYFKTVRLYEIYYKTDKGLNILVLAKDGRRYESLRHEEFIYKMEGFPFEILYFNKHNHKLYARSDIDIVKGLQERINTTFESIVEQVEKYTPKLFVDETQMTDSGKKALVDGEIGSVCYTKADPSKAVKEAQFIQLKGDLVALIDKTLEIIMLETGLTRAQLMGMTGAQTATEAQIAQGGQNLRMQDKSDAVNDYSCRQASKLWQITQQFVDLEEIQLITGDQGIDEVTGAPKFSWIKDIDSDIAAKMVKGQYSFDIEVGSMEKPDVPIIRKQLEGLANILMGKGVMEAFQMQGYKIELAELLKIYLKTYPNVIPNVNKIIKPIGPQTQGLLPPQQPQPGGGPPGQGSMNPPNIADILSGSAGEKGQGTIPLA